MMDDKESVAEFERLAEVAYGAMYDVRPHHVKDCYDDARFYFSRAIDAARRAGLSDEVVRFSLRDQHVEYVYNSQFRGIG